MNDHALTHKASMVIGYRMRLLIISLMLLLFTAWCAYDGFVKYPHEQERWELFSSLQDENNPEWRREWERQAAERGWSVEKPDDKKPMDIYTQYIMGGLLLPPGLLLLAVFFITGGKWYGVDDQALHTNSGKRVTWDEITDVDLSRWKTKGIAIVYYKNMAGQVSKITLDDWKYDRFETGAVLNTVLEKTGREPVEVFTGEDALEEALADEPIADDQALTDDADRQTP